MASLVIGSAIGSKVLQRQNFNKEPNGLETIIEAYAIQTANRDTVVPEKNTLHSAFSSSAKKYSRMVVESVTTEEQDGGITQMLVTFVGLTSSTGLPPPIVRLIPTPDAGIFGPPLVIEAEFITDVSESQFIQGNINATAQIKLGNISFGQVNQMPAQINGTLMPSNPIAPFTGQQQGNFAINNYFGYCTDSHACERRGLFLVARTIYKELQANFRFS
jgi:hypothetical protein